VKIARKNTMHRAKTKALRKKFTKQKLIYIAKTLQPQDLQLLILKPP
jgi:hypothetical protein